MYRGENISHNAQILRHKQTKQASLKIDIFEKWALYAGTSIKTIDYTAPILEGEGSGTFDLDVSLTHRIYFSLRTATSRAIITESHLPMAGGFNFRDMGGIKTKSGKHIKWGKLFRADEMSSLTDEDLTYLASIPITSVIDFRAQSEAKRSPDKLPNTVRFFYPIAITPSSLSNEGIQNNILKADIESLMKENNRLLVSERACIRAYRSLFAIIQNNLSAPLIFHCTAGKDRTGMGAALVLIALGVDEHTVMRDYLASKEYLEDKYSTYVSKFPRAEDLFTVKRSYLQTGLNQIKADHGSVLDYITKVLKVDLIKLRKMYLIEEDEKQGLSTHTSLQTYL